MQSQPTGINLRNTASRPIKLFVTARDPATAVSFQILLPKLAQNSNFELCVLAQEPAATILAEVDYAISTFSALDSFEQIQHKVKKIINEFQPDAVLTGISGPDAGIDEAALKIAEFQGIQSYALQSFWGDINQLSGAVPNHAFVLDDEAQRLTNLRYKEVRCIPIGSIKHADFDRYDVLALREKSRQNVDDDEVIIGFYGQPILEIKGYFETLEAMVRQLKTWPRRFKLIYRPHPKESQILFDKTRQLFENAFADAVEIDEQADIVNSLVKADLVVSVFSTCGFDNLYLNEISSTAFNASVYLWFDSCMIQWWKDYSGLENMPLISEGLLLSVDKESEMLDIFEQGLKLEVQHQLWLQAKAHLPDASLAVQTVIETLLEDFNAVTRLA